MLRLLQWLHDFGGQLLAYTAAIFFAFSAATDQTDSFAPALICIAFLGTGLGLEALRLRREHQKAKPGAARISDFRAVVLTTLEEHEKAIRALASAMLHLRANEMDLVEQKLDEHVDALQRSRAVIKSYSEGS